MDSDEISITWRISIVILTRTSSPIPLFILVRYVGMEKSQV
jgi:hypothetical protein